ncbi:hypothetical protein PC129_g1428 [Phytophthora cactorum]|uniref:Uncharacterized protein n=1 Tax=Phytophthora cactorum TaxID=29920 RepID=A0A8T0ZWD1_9STRA|nr:hypothetical protein Pcac1_g10893 [Phytophthora cactorum]KAG2826488.1 hypothetical protein PC112_g9274 [Phytophthora cactorum]KAG2828912.1 hypothetical protein PC111_g7993 [Phytophthora cactorum]KAG2866371.1 hypothetical protein PC113_g2899 [Phytophthora cactorum]KAG2928757.1 hypothetical protein PC114_g3000 [Phytophthora cactorum]
MIGSPVIIFLDELSTGMDPVLKGSPQTASEST